MVHVASRKPVVLENPTTIAVAGGFSLPTSASYVVRGSAVASGAVMSINNGRSHWIQNTGSIGFSVASTGNSTVLLDGGDSMMVMWDAAANVHRLNVMRSKKAVVFNGQQIVTLIDQAAQQMTLTPAIGASSLSWQINGIDGTTSMAAFTPTTGVLSWAGLELFGRIEYGNIVTYQYQLA